MDRDEIVRVPPCLIRPDRSQERRVFSGPDGGGRAKGFLKSRCQQRELCAGFIARKNGWRARHRTAGNKNESYDACAVQQMRNGCEPASLHRPSLEEDSGLEKRTFHLN